MIRLRRTFTSTVPRQHGAWSILLASYVLGVGCAGRWTTASLVLLAAALFGFLARQAAVVFLRLPHGDERTAGVAVWGALYGVSAALAGYFLLLGFALWRLALLGVAAGFVFCLSAALERKRLDKTLGGEVLGVLGLTLVAPAAAYAATGDFDLRTGALWFLAAGFFAATVVHVRYVMRRRRERAPSTQAAASLVCHGMLVAAAVALANQNLVPPLTPVALLPAVARAVRAVGARSDARVAVRRLGWAEVAVTTAFVGLTVLAYHLPWGP